jgi:hypothetical protein
MASIRELIEQRAYEIFLERGGVHGYHMEDWLRAEREVSGWSAPKKTYAGAVLAPKTPAISRPAFTSARKRKRK